MKKVLILLLSAATLSSYAQSPKNVSPFKINQIKKKLENFAQPHHTTQNFVKLKETPFEASPQIGFRDKRAPDPSHR